MNIFAIDLGNKQAKLKSERGEYVYPSSYLSFEDIPKGGIIDRKLHGNHLFQLSSEDEAYVWGDNLQAYRMSDNMIQTLGYGNRFDGKIGKRLFEFALGRLAADFPEAKEKPMDIRLVMGVPADEFYEDSEQVNTLRKMAVGKHIVRVDGADYMINVPDVSCTLIMPQYMGSVLHTAFDEKGNEDTEISKRTIGVVDIGGGTILANIVTNLEQSSAPQCVNEGVRTLLKQLVAKSHVTKEYALEMMLKTGNSTDGYIYNPNGGQRDIQDLTDVVEGVKEAYVRRHVAKFIKDSFPSPNEVDVILLTGGGANLVSFETIADEIGMNYAEKLELVEQSERANVRGYKKAANLVWSE